MPLLKNPNSPLKGLALIAILSLAAIYISTIPLIKELSLSPLIIGIIVGMIVANGFSRYLSNSLIPGIKLCTKQILRLGIVLYGFRLTLQDIYDVGMPAVVVDTIIVTCTLFLGIFLGKLLKIDKETALLTATGSSICGAAAVLGAEGVVKPQSYKTAIAVCTVVIFGTLAMFLYPLLYRMGILSNLSDTGVAVYTGATLHEVAHVAAAGNAMDPLGNLGIAAQATITKMIRVMFLAPVLIIMAICLNRSRQKTNGSAEKSKITVPYFAFFFMIVIGINTLLLSFFDANSVSALPLNHEIEFLDTFLLTLAMTALGVDTTIDKFKKAGAKPFILASLLFVWLIFGGYLVTSVVCDLLA